MLEYLLCRLVVNRLGVMRKPCVARTAFAISGLVWFAIYIRLSTISRNGTSTTVSSSIACLRSKEGVAGMGLYFEKPKRFSTL